MLLSIGSCLFLKKSFFIPRNLKQTAYSVLFIAVLLLFSGCNPGNRESCQWHSFHGPDRTNKSEATGLLNEWPEDGPALKWTASGLGEGYSSVAIADGYIYTAGKKSDQTLVFCFDLEGNSVWEQPNGKAWSTNMSHARSYTGARSTPTFDNGTIYHLGETGRLAAFDAKTGEEFWASELADRFNASETEYGFSESVMIDGDKLYVRPAGKDGYQVCLNKHDGELIWATTAIPGVEGYSSPVIMEFGGYRQLINASSDCYYGVDTETGQLLWKVDYRNRQGLNVADAEMIMHLEREDGKLKGEMRGDEGNNPIKIERIEEKENSISVYYFASGYDISMTFEKKDENNLKGNLLGMFTANGTRVVE